MTSISSISQQIWDMKYRLKGPDGAPVDKVLEDSWSRVARALAAPEKDRARWEERFNGAMADFRFLPAGRILAGAGTGRSVTLFNCFVMGAIPDDMGGIFENLKEAALTMQQGGGIGYDFSTLRPRGAPVKGVGADASGPLSFMDVWDAMCRTIMSAGHRRGAMMATLQCDHPDIEAFIDAKREPGRLRMFNLSVLVTDAFMQAIREDASWELKFDGAVVKTLPARALWDKIMRATYAYAEPGVIFIDRVNRLNPLNYIENISATNPCVTADTWVHTDEGPKQVADIVGRPFTAIVDGKPFRSGAKGFFRTARKPVLKLATREGHMLRLTADHLVLAVRSRTRDRITTAWVEAGSLQPGAEIILHDHRSFSDWDAPYNESDGYLMGLLVGDGTLKSDAAVLCAWPGRLIANGGVERPGVLGVMAAAESASRTLRHRSDFGGWAAIESRGEHRLKLAAVRDLAFDFGMTPGDKRITAKMEATSSAFHRGFLRGYFDADGSVQGEQKKGVSIRLSQSDLERLEAVQRMLLRLGIASKIYRNRRPAGMSLLPDGKGGYAHYPTKPQHELVVSSDNIPLFAEVIGFSDNDKAARLRIAITGYRRALNRERFIARIATIEPDGVEDVFDVQIPGINAFDANGLVVHNCGEQPLPPYGACLLGSINLAKLVRNPFEENAELDMAALGELVPLAVRMMDNVVDISRFPLPAQKKEALSKRRIGLGVTGLGDTLIMCRARYGGTDAVRLTETWMKAIQRGAYLASADLAAEKGAFPLFEKEKYLAGPAIAGLDDDIRAAIEKHGLRNALLTSIAPTGTISIFADNVSSGLEPVFSFTYRRSILMQDGSRREEEVSDHAYRLFKRLKGANAPLPDYFVDAQQLTPADHLVMQAAAQKYVDSSISKTINVPQEIAFEDFRDIYTQAYDLGCKGCTTYRPNEVTGSVLKATSEEANDSAQAELPLPSPTPRPQPRPRDEFEAGGVVYMTQPLSRPEELPGKTYKIRWPESDHAIYITINDVVRDGRRRPFEVFINSKNMEHYAWTVALTRMISAVFRRGGDVSFVVEELKAVFDPRGGQWMGRKYVPSLLAAIGEVIEAHMIDIGLIPAPHDKRQEIVETRQIVGAGEGASAASGHVAMRACPKCGAYGLIRQENCDICTNCGYSKCS